VLRSANRHPFHFFQNKKATSNKTAHLIGNTYRNLGKVEMATEHLKQALVIFEEIKSPNADRVRQWLEELTSKK